VLVGCGWNNSSALRLLACDFCCLAAACLLTRALPVGFQFSLSGPLPLALCRAQPLRQSWPCTESLALLLSLPLCAAWRHALA